jgi:hypothetical protein
VKRNVAVTAHGTSVSLGTLLEGNANNDNSISALDFVALSVAYNNPGAYNAMADFDRNGLVNSLDFILLSVNYFKTSPIEIP